MVGVRFRPESGKIRGGDRWGIKMSHTRFILVGDVESSTDTV